MHEFYREGHQVRRFIDGKVYIWEGTAFGWTSSRMPATDLQQLCDPIDKHTALVLMGIESD